jgi:hypothetical protein
MREARFVIAICYNHADKEIQYEKNFPHPSFDYVSGFMQ